MDKKIVVKMNKLLSSLIVFYAKLNNMHWNFKGATFFEMHEELEKFYDEVREHFDAVAEKLVMSGEIPNSTLKESLDGSEIKECSSKVFHYKEVCEEVVRDCSTIIKLASDIPEFITTQPLMDEIIASFDKRRWMFKATIQ